MSEFFSDCVCQRKKNLVSLANKSMKLTLQATTPRNGQTH